MAVLKLVRGARFAEIGKKLGVSEAAAKMRFVRALEEFLRADARRSGIPPGFIRIDTGESGGGREMHAQWVGYVVKDGVSVTITTGLSEHAVVATGRALRTAQ